MGIKKTATPKENYLAKTLVRQIGQLQTYGYFKKDFIIYHNANERKCSIQEGKHYKDLGVLAGVFDYTILLPEGRVAYIELKRNKSCKLSEAQKRFAIHCERLAIPYLVTYDLTEAISFIEHLLQP